MQITQERLDNLTADLNGDLHAVKFITVITARHGCFWGNIIMNT